MKKLVSVFLSVILLIFSVLVSQATGLYSYDTDFNSAIALNRGTDGHSQEPLEETENEISDALGGELQVTWLDEGLHVTGDFSDGLAAVVNKDGYGYINTAGELVITLGSNYNAIFDFTGGLAVVYKNSKFGCIDTSGTLVLPCIYDWIINTGDNILIVLSDGRYGIVDSSGKEIAPCIYDYLNLVSDDIIQAGKDQKHGLLNSNGDFIVPCIYDAIWYKDGIACLLKDGETTYIDKDGNTISPPEKGIMYFYSEEKLNTVYKDGKWGLTNSAGELVVPFIYDDVRDYYDEFIQVSQNGKWGLINRKGDLVAPCIYDDVYDFRNGLARVREGEKYGFINTYGTEIVPCIYGYALDFSDGLALVADEDYEGRIRYGFVNTAGDLLIPLIFSDARSFRDGFAAVMVNDRWGLIRKPSQLIALESSNNDFYYEIKGSAVRITGLANYFDDLVIPSTIDGYPVTVIGESAFEYKSFKSIKIPDTVKIIEEFAFYGARLTGDSTLYIPSSVREIHSYAFSYISGVEAFVVDPLNRDYCSLDGVLFSKNKLSLINYPLAKKGDTYHVPPETVSLFCTSFGNCRQLKYLYVPNKNASMAGYTFFGCDLTVYAQTGSPLQASIERLAEENYERGKVAFRPIDSNTGIITENNNVSQSVSPPVENMISSWFERWAGTKNSYLVKNNDGTLTVLEVSDRVNIHTYDKKYNLIESKCIYFELPIFGAFYSGEMYNYIAFGQKNPDENDKREVIRIVKYTKDFTRIDSVSVRGGESFTVSPFYAGCARFAEYGNQLVLHTSRLRYATEDGLNHQSQLTVIVNIDEMSVVNYLGRYQPNHVSHSFDQFVLFDRERPVFVDHGDAYPRSVVLHKQINDYEYTAVNLFDIPGKTGANFTGVSVGGFEMSSDNYLVVINSIDHNIEGEYGNFGKSGLIIDERDVILCVVPKNNLSDSSVKHVRLTNYIGTDRYASVPKLVKINDNKFMVLWQEIFSDRTKYGDWPYGDVKYVVVDGSGNMTGKIQTLGYYILSDCDPIVIENKVVWYANLSERKFYEIPVE